MTLLSGPHDPPAAELLAAHALGLLAPAEQAAVEAALARDPALKAEHAEIVRHLALYAAFPAPPEPPAFERIRTAVEAPRRWTGSWIAAAAAVLVVGGGAALVAHRMSVEAGRAPLAVFGPGSGTSVGTGLDAGALVAAHQILDLRIAGRVDAVLDRGSALRLVSKEEVRLERGRAYFEVDPATAADETIKHGAPLPFRVTTDAGEVLVLGTKFEVDVRAGLVVTVETGRVACGGALLTAGERFDQGVRGPAPEPAGAFFRRPVLSLEGPGSARPGESVLVRLVFENPGPLRQELAGPETVAAGALLSFAGPGGEVVTRGLDFAQALSGGFEALRPVALGPRERRLVVFRVQVPDGPAGSWRLSALYRPRGAAALASQPLTLEVR